MTIQDLLVQDGSWPDITGRHDAYGGLVIRITAGDWIPRNEWYGWSNKVGGYPGYRVKCMLYLPETMKKGDTSFVHDPTIKPNMGDTYDRSTTKA